MEEQRQLVEKRISELEELLVFGEKVLSTLQVNSLTTPFKKFILFSLTGAVQSYTEAIVTLLKQGKTNAAHVILRSIIEAYINISYIFLERSNENVYRFMAHDEHDRLKLGKKMQKYLSDNPTEQGEKPGHDLSHWQKFTREREEFLKIIKKKYPKHNTKIIPNLSQRVEIIDKKNKKSNFLWLYLAPYWYFSHWAHLSARGLNFFFDTDEASGDIIFQIDGNPSDAERICVTCYSIYLGFIVLIHEKFSISKNILKQYKDRMKIYIKAAKKEPSKRTRA